MGERRWMRLTDALRDPAVSFDDKLAIGAACLEEEALMRTAQVIAGPGKRAEWYVGHGGRFRFSDDGEHLMIEVPVRPFILDPPRCSRKGCGRPQAAHDLIAHAFQAP